MSIIDPIHQSIKSNTTRSIQVNNSIMIEVYFIQEKQQPMPRQILDQ